MIKLKLDSDLVFEMANSELKKNQLVEAVDLILGFKLSGRFDIKKLVIDLIEAN